MLGSLYFWIAKSQSPKPTEAAVESYITDRFVKDGSLKAQKAERDRIAAELAEEERLRAEKADKRQKSGRKVCLFITAKNRKTSVWCLPHYLCNNAVGLLVC